MSAWEKEKGKDSKRECESEYVHSMNVYDSISSYMAMIFFLFYKIYLFYTNIQKL